MKKIISLAMTLVMLVSCFACVTVFADDAIKVIIDGKNLTMDQPPVLKDGRTLVPLRAIFEALGAKVSWDDATKCATGTKDGKEIKITIDNTVAKVDGKDITLDVPAQIVNARTLVPVRFISESLGASVAWNGDTKTVTITSASSAPASSVLFEEHFDDKTSYKENTDFVMGGVYKAENVSLSLEVDHTLGNGKSLKMNNRTATTDRVKFKNAFNGAKIGTTYLISAWVYVEEDAETVSLSVYGDKGTSVAFNAPARKHTTVKAKTWTKLEVLYKYENTEVTQVGIDQANTKVNPAKVIYVDDVKVEVSNEEAPSASSAPSTPKVEPTPVVTGKGLMNETFDSLTSLVEKTHYIVGGAYDAKAVTISSDVDHTTGNGKAVKLSNRTKTDHRIKFVNAFDGAKKGDKFEITAWVYTTETEESKIRMGVYGDIGTKTAFTSPKYALADVKPNTWVQVKLEYEYDNEEITQIGIDQVAGKSPILASFYVDDVKVTKK